MQEKEKYKQKVLKALAEVTKELRGTTSQFLLSSENDIYISIISTIERGLKDPQLTTFIKLAEALNIVPDKFLKKIIEKLPQDFSLIEK